MLLDAYPNDRHNKIMIKTFSDKETGLGDLLKWIILKFPR